MTVLEQWDVWGLKVLGTDLLSSLAVFPMQCSESCWSKTGSSPWNSGLSDACGRSGKCEMGCDYAFWVCHGVSDDGWHPLGKDSASCCGG